MTEQNSFNSQNGENVVLPGQIGSDFDPIFFTPEENQNLNNVLTRMRTFESAICRQFRKLEREFSELKNLTHQSDDADRMVKIERSIIDLEDRGEMDNFQMEEKMIKVAEKAETLEIRQNAFERLTKVKFNKVVEKMKVEMAKITENFDVLKIRVEFLEMENKSEDDWNENGHSFEHKQLPSSNDSEDQPNEMESCEIMISDPFLGGIAPLEMFDGNPSVSFSRWASKFVDMLSLLPQLTETQKLSRLRILLIGQARAEFEALDPPPENLTTALNHLKSKFENENTRSIARQALSICKQAPGERVYEFANRLNEAIRTALAGESEEAIRKRLMEEFMERLIPELQFEVKAGRPNSYSGAYELAQHFELLLASRRTNQISVADSVAELSSKVEALSLGQYQRENVKGGPDRRRCYYCRRPGHLVRDCKTKKRDERQNSRGPQRNNEYYGNERHWNRGPNGGENSRFVNRREQRNEREFRRSPTPNMRPRGYSNNSGSPGRRVSFGGRFAAARIASPILMAFIAILSLFAPNIAANTAVSPMICLSDAPSSLWSIPSDPFCPTWTPTVEPIPANFAIFRQNTIQYKTEATACKCVKTSISRRIGFFGGKIEEISTSPVEVPTAICHQMKEMKYSPAGDLNFYEGNKTFRATNNSLEVGWSSWPTGIFWRTNEVTNCYVYGTVVFTRHGMPGISTPVNDCNACVYQSGNCHCSQISLIWKPDQTHQCAYVEVGRWGGEYSTRIWTANYGDFALTFLNASRKSDCDGTEFVISDQAFAVPAAQYDEIIKRSGEPNERRKREIGLVYSSQLSAQLTALSVKISQNTQRLFTETIRQICMSLKFLADQTLALAEANPTLLARFYLGNPFLSARLVTKETLEIKPCFAINEREMHFNWQSGHCFDKLPIIFNLYGRQKHGFLDPNTMIIHPRAGEIDCNQAKHLYIVVKGSILQYDQMTGEMTHIPYGSLHQLSRHGKIDFPEFPVQFFKNKVMANLTELYSPENFNETMEVAKFAQEIARLSKPNAWESPSEKSEQMAANIVSSGLFAFLKGGIFTINQLWVFVCCCYVTITVLIQILLPQRIAQAIQYLNLVGQALNVFKNNRKNRDKNDRVIELKNNDQRGVPRPILKKREMRSITPLTERWLSPELGTATPLQRSLRFKENEMEQRVVQIAVAETNCDPNFRIVGMANDKKVIHLLDTGAHVTLCGIQTAKRLGITELEPAKITGVIGVSGKIVNILGQKKIEMQIFGCTVETVIYVAEAEIGGVGTYDIIVGRKTFRQLPLLLDLQTGTLIRKEDGQTYNCEKFNEKDVYFYESENKKENGEKIKEELEICLEKHKSVFARHEYDLGTCAYCAPPILTTSDLPERVRPYPVPEKYEEELKAQIEKMLKSGVIRESCTPWAHNIVLVKKSNGQLRPCVDFRPLNKVTVPDPYPIPRMDKTILRAAGKKWYSTLDLASGFWQIPLDKDSSYKCGILTPWGLYQMLKMPFGLRNAPSIFQRVMDKVLKDLPNVTAYIDDILIHTDSEKEHLETLESVFEKLEENGLKLKKEKCCFFKSECTYLGHILNKNGYRPSMNNREVIEAFPAPKNVKEVKRFLGMISFFRKFIPEFAVIAHPLNQLTKKENEFNWLEKEEEAFGKLKQQLLKAPCLRAPNYKLPFYLFTDASAVAYAGALMQSADENQMHAVGFWSRTLNSTEAKFPPTHGELAAIVHAVQNFKPIIYGAELIILTDHRPLTFLFSKSSSNPKLNRWLMSLQEFEPKVVYLEGKANRVADALSRVPIKWDQIESKCKEDIPFLLVTDEENGLEINREKIEKETTLDPILSQIVSKIKENWVEPIQEELNVYYKQRDQLYLEGNLIRKKPLRQIVIPEKMRNLVLKLLHRAHFGIVRNKARARNQVWWPEIGDDVENFVKSCWICQKNGPNPPKTDADYKWPDSMFPFERVHADLAGPIWGTNFFILVDAYSKFPFVYQMNSTHSSALINSLRELFGIFGSPKTLVTDNGTQFVSNEMEMFLQGEGIRHLTSPTYHPSSNGEAERFVRTFKEGMGKMLEDGKSIKIAQFVFLQEYRATPCSAADGQSPSQRFLGRELRTELDKIKMSASAIERKRRLLPEANRERDLVTKNFEPGDLVWVKEPNGKWTPGVLLRPIGERIWEVEPEGCSISKSAHLDQLKARRAVTRHH